MYIVEEIYLSLRIIISIIREPEAEEQTGKRGAKKKQREGEIKKEGFKRQGGCTRESPWRECLIER